MSRLDLTKIKNQAFKEQLEEFKKQEYPAHLSDDDFEFVR